METVLVGKSVLLIPHTVYSPDAYYAKLAMNGLEGETPISQDKFVNLKPGVTVDVEYSKKRFSNELSFNSVIF